MNTERQAPKLSDRLRPDVECAPWVIESVKKLESENAKLREALERTNEKLRLTYRAYLCNQGISEADAEMEVQRLFPVPPRQALAGEQPS